MNEIIEYILANYTWIIGGAIIIFLAIIGFYADKTNFGQGKQNDQNIQDDDIKRLAQDEDIMKKVNGIRINSLIDANNPEEAKEYNNEISTTKEHKDKIVQSKENIEGQKEFDKNFEEFNEEFDEFLPEKDVITGDLLNEIDDLSLDKTQKFKLSDIPDLDDVELPKIKNLKSADENIWEFKK